MTDLTGIFIIGNHVEIHSNAGAIKDVNGQNLPFHDLHLVILPDNQQGENSDQVWQKIRKYDGRRTHRRPFQFGIDLRKYSIGIPIARANNHFEQLDMTALSKIAESTTGLAYLGDDGAGGRGRTGAGLVGPRDFKFGPGSETMYHYMCWIQTDREFRKTLPLSITP
jgi:hypothetical protein